MQLFRTPTPAAANLIEKLIAQITAANLEIINATTRYDALALDAADGKASQSDADKAHADLVKARSNLERLQGVLEAATARQLAEEDVTARAVTDAAWKHTVAESKRRAQLANEFATKLADAATIFRQLKESVAKVHQALPMGHPSHAAAGFAIEADILPALARVEYSRLGLPGGPALEGNNPAPFEQRYQEATAVIEKARKEAGNV